MGRLGAAASTGERAGKARGPHTCDSMDHTHGLERSRRDRNTEAARDGAVGVCRCDAIGNDVPVRPLRSPASRRSLAAAAASTRAYSPIPEEDWPPPCARAWVLACLSRACRAGHKARAILDCLFAVSAVVPVHFVRNQTGDLCLRINPARGSGEQGPGFLVAWSWRTSSELSVRTASHAANPTRGRAGGGPPATRWTRYCVPFSLLAVFSVTCTPVSLTVTAVAKWTNCRSRRQHLLVYGRLRDDVCYRLKDILLRAAGVSAQQSGDCRSRAVDGD